MSRRAFPCGLSIVALLVVALAPASWRQPFLPDLEPITQENLGQGSRLHF